jgi:hypothetical protein
VKNELTSLGDKVVGKTPLSIALRTYFLLITPPSKGKENSVK